MADNRIVQDEAGDIFYEGAGGIYTKITPAQAQAIQESGGAVDDAIRSANLKITNIGTGAMSLLSDDPKWLELNRLGKEQAEALEMVNPVTSKLASFLPELSVGAATSGFGLVPTVAAEAGLGAASMPETPWQGAAIGAAAGGAGYLLPGAVQSLYGRGRQAVGDLPGVAGWMRNRQALDAVSANPGGLRPGDLDALGVRAADMMPSGAADDVAGMADDLASRPRTAAERVTAAIDDAGQPQARGAGMADEPRTATDRVTAAINNADQRPPQARVLDGTMTPEELAEHGVPTSPAQQRMLRARVGGNEYEDALQALRMEEGRMSTPIYGDNLQLTRQLQRRSATNFLATELDLPQGQNITDGLLADKFQAMGRQFDDMALNMGNVQIDDGIRAQMNDVLEQVTADHAGQLQKYAREIEAKAARNAGELSGEDWQLMRTKLSNMVEAGQTSGNYEKMIDAGKMLDVFTQALEAKLPDAQRMQLASLRKQYAIAQTLTKPGVRDANGVINPGAFYRNWKKPQSKKLMAKDSVGRFMNTLGSLTTNVEPNSGTAWRLGMQGARLGAGAALGAAGLGGLNSLIN